MAPFFNKKTNETNIPEWASFFSEEEYSLFIQEIDNYFKSLNSQYQYKPADGQVLADENLFGFTNLGLMNVAQVCKQNQQQYYKNIIIDHFTSLMRVKQFNEYFAKIADNFEEIKKYIGVRLYNDEYVATVGKENTVGKAFAGDIYAMIVFDFPNAVKNVKPQDTTAWNKTVDELFETGVENIKNNYPLTITKVNFGEFHSWFVQGEHFFTPNIVFDIENRPELTGSKGALIGLPHRHSALIYPIENSEVLKAINGLIPPIYGMNQEGPGSLSNNLFWYRDKTFTQLPYKIEDNKFQFFPPEEFVEMLNELKKI
jgi:hypothetical protein